MNKKINKVCFISGTRAEFGLLKILIKKFYSSPKFETYFLVTGSHLSKKHGETINEIIQSNIQITNVVNLEISDDSAFSTTQYIARGLKKFGIEFETTNVVKELTNYWKMVNIVKPLKGISTYKITELRKIYKYLYPVESETKKKLTKQKIYNLIRLKIE